jgi:hypothetical protein
MDQSKIVIGGNIVIASGSLVVPDDTVLTIAPINVGISPLVFEFGFETNALLPVQVTAINLPNNRVRLAIRNFDQQGGASLIEPLACGSIANRQLSVYLAIHTIGPQKVVRVVTYTFMLAGDANVG